MEGLIVNLKKRNLNAHERGLGNNTFFIWGYFDWLSVTRITNWNSFAPRNMPGEGLNNNNSFSSEFFLKLVAPENISNLQALSPDSTLINYNQHDIYNSDFSGKPLLSVVLMHYTREAVEKHTMSRLIQKTVTRLKHFLEPSVKNGKSKVSFAVYPSIGYVDAVALCRSNSFSAIAKAVYAMRAEASFLASSYILPSVLSNASTDDMNEWINSGLDADTRLSIRATLKPGVSTENVFNECKDEFDKHNIITNDKNEAIFYEMFGNSDILIAPQMSVTKLYNLYSDDDDHVFQPPFRYLLSNTRASVRIYTEMGTGGAGSKPPERDDISIKYEKDSISKLIDYITTGRDAYLVSIGLKDSLLTLLHFYFDATSSEHTFDIRKMLDPALDSFLGNLAIVKQEHTHLVGESYKYSDELSQDITDFCNYFNNLISDFARADRHLLEGRWLRHPAVASASKLIMAYHRFVSKITSAFDERNKYSFMVTGSGIDSIKSLFSFNPPQLSVNVNDYIENKLAIISISEDSLFKISNTLFRVTHEIFHMLTGVYDNKNYLESIIKSMAAFTAHSICQQTMTLNPQNDLIWQPFKLTTKLKFNKLKQLNEVRLAIMKSMRISLTNKFNEAWKDFSNIEKWKPEEKIFWNFTIFDKMRTSLSTGDIAYEQKSELVDQVVEIISEHLFYFAHKYRILNSDGNHIVEVDEIEMKNLYLKNVNKEKYFHFFSDIRDASERHINAIGWMDAKNAREKMIFTIENMMDTICTSYEETISDLGSIITLGSSCNLNNYLLSFVNQDGDLLLTKDYSDIFRVISVIKRCFPKCLKEIESSGGNFSIPGSPRGFKNHIMNYSNKYSSLSYITEPLEFFLLKCKHKLDELVNKNNDKLMSVREVYSKSQNENVDNETISLLFDEWRSLANKP